MVVSSWTLWILQEALHFDAIVKKQIFLMLQNYLKLIFLLIGCDSVYLLRPLYYATRNGGKVWGIKQHIHTNLSPKREDPIGPIYLMECYNVEMRSN